MATIARPARRAGIASAALVAALLLVLQQLPAAGPDTNVAHANQAAIIDRALSELQPSSPSDPSGHIYFVGFAGYGPEAVFKREVVAVRELFNARFGTSGRSVALVNHVTTVDELPLASAQNLERALQHVGKIMDPGRDTLFLFLTSHGERALLAVVMPGLRLEHLTPGMLKSMLDRSGIKRRIVVVSACHSGSFVPALANANTLVIAAARADRTSLDATTSGNGPISAMLISTGRSGRRPRSEKHSSAQGAWSRAGNPGSVSCRPCRRSWAGRH